MMSQSSSEKLSQFAASFQREDGIIPLNNAGMSPLNSKAAQAMSSLLSEMMRADVNLRNKWIQQYQAAHATFASLVDCAPQDITFMPNVATALSAIAYALDLKAGDEILTVDQEYGSNAYPWHAAAQRAGAHVVKAQSRPDFSLATQAIIELLGPRTRALAISMIQFQSGTRLDLEALSLACRNYGTLLIVDTTQALGIVPFSMQASGAHIIAGSMHKWLCGPPGLAYLAIQPACLESLKPQVVGPYSYGELPLAFDPEATFHSSAARFQSGTPALLPIIGAAAAAASILDAGVEVLSAQAMVLAHQLYQGLQSQGHQLLSTETLNNPIVSFIPRQGLASASQKLAAHGISYALRAGGLRLAPHAFNSSLDIETALKALA